MSAHRSDKKAIPLNGSDVLVISNLKSTLSRQAATARHTIQFLEEQLHRQMQEYRSTLAANLERETQLRERLRRLREEVERCGLFSRSSSPFSEAEVPPISGSVSGTWTPADVVEFESDLRDLVALRDRLLQNIDPVDMLSELKHSS